jgi:hypothetical protein
MLYICSAKIINYLFKNMIIMLKKFHLTALTVFSFVFFVSNIQAQRAFENWAVGIDGGTYGPGVHLATSLSSHFKLRAGVNVLPYTYNGNFDWDVTGFLEKSPETRNIDMSVNINRPKVNFTNFKAIVDYYPMENGIFSLSLGLYAGNNTVSISSKIDKYQDLIASHGGEYPVFKLFDMAIKPKSDGSFSGKIKPKNVAKPYFGLGLGRTIANSRVGFRFELGAIYQGEYKFESNDVSGSRQAIQSEFDKLLKDKGIPKWATTFWPVLNFSLSYRFK